ncbi:macro domain-containing protein [Bacillus cereus]|uniref:macro domain-containing protein n=1 Tax=Bacillus cereus group TaxID=86661 RepID=UPI000CFA31D5|nr:MULTISPECIES: macro domain-containing protein [Bacillus cereus group]MDZ4482700.1 macro domain-containing protein [Bacillus cereus]PQQ45505.1 hypothetical protein C6A34_19445 [Bacillus thuringiensis]
MITYVKMDLFQSPAHVLVNTINTVGVMGKGIAKTFKEVYPDMFKEYQILCEKELLTVGKLWIYKTPNKWILNFPTKKHWRSPSKIEYIEAGLQKFVKSYEEKGIDSIAFPPLGCGNGGLNWESEVKPLMEKYLKDLPIDIYIHLPPAELKTAKKEHLNVKEIKNWLHSQPNSLSFYEVWEDIVNLIESEKILFSKGETYELKILERDEQTCIQFILAGKIEEITKEQLNDIWDYLRNVGICTSKSIPSHLVSQTNLVFNLLNGLPYIRPLEVAHGIRKSGDIFEMGIRLVPVYESGSQQGELMI